MRRNPLFQEQYQKLCFSKQHPPPPPRAVPVFSGMFARVHRSLPCAPGQGAGPWVVLAARPPGLTPAPARARVQHTAAGALVLVSAASAGALPVRPTLAPDHGPEP